MNIAPKTRADQGHIKAVAAGRGIPQAQPQAQHVIARRRTVRTVNRLEDSKLTGFKLEPRELEISQVGESEDCA